MRMIPMNSFVLRLALGACVLSSVSAYGQLEGHAIESSATPHPVPAIQDKETPAQHDARMAWWREARFGMFIHWGLYAVPAGEWHGQRTTHIGEWIMNDLSIPVADYKQFATNFNPTGFSAHDIVALAKDAGMKYIVITSKHHDGFAMFDSKTDPFNIVAATPFKKDPLRELAEECHKAGIRLGFYYSQAQDWTAPGGAAAVRGTHNKETGHWDPAQDGSFDDYLKTKAIPQIKELLSNYKTAPDIIWFDTPTSRMTPERAAEVVKVLNQYPKLIWNNRLGGGYKGDTETPEQYIPAQGYPGRDWESCMTINDTWGYKSFDTNFKSTETLLRNLIDITSKGGNYLLNIGPDAQGKVPEPEVERLHAMGKWLAVNGEAVYGAKATLFGAEAGSFAPAEGNAKPKFVPAWEWRSTTKANRIYIHLFAWPKGSFHVEKVPRTITKAYLLADSSHKALKFTQRDGVLDVSLPEKALDPIATVLVLESK
ncbi:alpha-L-fucosidase [Terriglobus albidus]|uniref:alpha-L-fucosidase n=2 Tax=Terriglobus albidus TaxID=1592106 RepID=A0A5B9EIR8_9BACT|nr:alpha-L-fucosidase [Terriglobus albidus]